MTGGEALLILAALWMLAGGVEGPRGLTWPVPDWIDGGRRRRAVISQAYRGAQHAGVDILYRTEAGYLAPEGTPILAASTGIVEAVRRSPRGWSVVIDHQDNRYKTFYQHLDRVDVARGATVTAGQKIGIMGVDPLDPQRVRHLHFEVWGWGSGSAIDPTTGSNTWRRTTWKP